ncbi:hypothetical protein R1T16_00615 [Flavobacterium sp. DG1-102-2]|uniref:hypothetical protein n=1 Tax=Flavobacterium sp. DG1-102-2 TaxID=3081663 RepID=UPI002949ED95|nr:hypothetical protein [Flavobacterium sp. DG1-102-2]MDV6166907.1 hypothetical protein [Flavobacterium sp. DG1-102-2]
MLKYLLILFSISALAQKPAFTFAPGSDVEGYPEIQEQNKRLGYDAIENDSGDYSFRLSYNGTAITVYKLDNVYYGSIVYNIYETNEFGDKETGKTFKMTFGLSPQQAKPVLELIQETKIDTIPTDKLIPAWRPGFDGILYTLEHKESSVYSLKSYWTPLAQNNVSEAAEIENFIKKLSEILNLPDYLDKFRMQIPFQTYSDGSGSVISHFKTHKDSRTHQRKMKRYYGG